MSNKRGEKIRAFMKTLQFIPEFPTEFMNIHRGKVGESCVLRVCPDLLIGVEFGSVARELLGDDLGMLGEIGSYEPGPIMHSATVPDNRDGSPQVGSKTNEKAEHQKRIELRIEVVVEGINLSKCFTKGSDMDTERALEYLLDSTRVYSNEANANFLDRFIIDFGVTDQSSFSEIREARCEMHQLLLSEAAARKKYSQMKHITDGIVMHWFLQDMTLIIG